MQNLKLFLCLIGCFVPLTLIAQEQYKPIDSLYKEDQFYIAFTYNLLNNKPSSVSQTGFSFGSHLGFIKDIPINTKRNWAIGLGIGYSYSAINHNILINKDETNTLSFSNLDNTNNSFKKNNIKLHAVELPFEIRWRTSTASEYKFWRIYTGFKLGYVFYNLAKHQSQLGDIKHTNLSLLSNWRYGLTLSIGHNTVNGYLYYSLNPLFNNAKVENAPLNIKTIKIGLIFYVL